MDDENRLDISSLKDALAAFERIASVYQRAKDFLARLEQRL
jgi:exonuclease VII small subunit